MRDCHIHIHDTLPLLASIALACCSMGQERSANHVELAQQATRVQRMRDDGRDEHTIRKQVCALMGPKQQGE